MSRAETLANRSRRISEILMNNGTFNTLRVIKYCIESETELRRLAQVEAEHEALKKAISDAVPVAWVSRIGTPSVSWRQRDIGLLPDTTLLYTLKGIKK